MSFCPDNCTILERTEFIVEREREREGGGHFLPEGVEEQVESTSRNVGIRRVKREREREPL